MVSIENRQLATVLFLGESANTAGKARDFARGGVLVNDTLADRTHGRGFRSAERFLRRFRIARDDGFLNRAPRGPHASTTRLVDRRTAADDAVGFLCGLRIRHESSVPEVVSGMKPGAIALGHAAVK